MLFKIDTRTSFNEIEDEEKANEFLKFMSLISVSQESSVGEEINKLFKEILPENSSNLIKLNRALSSGKKVSSDTVYPLMDKILNSNNNTAELYLSSGECQDITTILSYGFKKLSKNVDNFSHFVEKISNLSRNDIELLHRYTINLSNKNELKRMAEEYPLPLELIILSKRFQTIRKIYLKIDSTVQVESNFFSISNSSITTDIKVNIKEFIFILINFDWLFLNAIEIEVDLSYKDLYEDLFSVYKSRLKSTKRIIKSTNYDTGFNTKRNFSPNYQIEESDCLLLDISEDDSFEKKNLIKVVDLSDILKKYNDIFNLIIIYAYFISKIKKLCVANLIMPDSFHNEILLNLAIKDIELISFDFFSFLSSISNLIQFTCDFNCLDMNEFENLISFIFTNDKMRTLKISFFPPEEYFSPQMLLKLIESLGMKLNNVVPEKITEESHNDFDNIVIEKLLDNFCENLSKFFLLLEHKTKLTEISLLFDLPSVILHNEKYCLAFLKFIFNFLTLLDKNNSQAHSLSLLMNYFPFDSRKYPVIDEFLEKFEFVSESRITHFKFYVRFSYVMNLYKFIPSKIQSLSLGEFDYETFINFVKDFIANRKNFKSLSTLTILLNNTICSYEPVKDSIFQLLVNYPKNLKEITLISWINATRSDIKKLVKKVNYNTLEKVLIEFNKITNKSMSSRERLNSSYGSGPTSTKEKCYYVTRAKRKIKYLLNILFSLSKYNKKILDLNIFATLERFTHSKYEKDFLVQTK